MRPKVARKLALGIRGASECGIEWCYLVISLFTSVQSKKKKKGQKKHRGAENAGSVTFRRLEVEIYLCGMRVARCDNMEIYLHHLCSTFIS